MRAILTIAQKDFKSLVSSPLYFVIAGLCSMIWSYSYIRTLFNFAEQNQAYMRPGADSSLNIQRQVFLSHISMVNILLVFLVPALTMRLLAEEKRMRTYDLLLTSPITATQIAIGKFLAGWGTATVLILISFLYPFATRIVAAYPMGPLLAAYLGMFLVCGAYVAVGLFASSLTESVILSVALGLLFNIVLWMIAQGASGDVSPPVAAVLEYVSLGPHFINFIIGSIKLKSLVFMFSLIGLFVFLTQRVIESSRWR